MRKEVHLVPTLQLCFASNKNEVSLMDETRHLMTNFIKKNLCDYEYEFKSKNHIRLLESNETIFMFSQL